MLDERDEELEKAFYDLVEDIGDCVSISDVYEILATQVPCSRYWVTPARAVRAISVMRRGVTDKWMPERKRMYKDIEERAKGVMAHRADLSWRQAVSKVVNSPAPSFYLTADSIKNTLYRLRKNRRNQ